MKKLIVVVVAIFGVIAIVVGGIYVKIVLIGSIMPAKSTCIDSIKVELSNVQICGEFRLDSALAYKGFKYRMVDNILYIKVYSVLVSDFYRSGKVNISINGDFSNLQKVVIEDNKNEEVVWEK